MSARVSIPRVSQTVLTPGPALYNSQAMWKYILAAFFLVIGSFELVLAFHGPLRRAILESSPALANRVGPVSFAVIGFSALLTGFGILAFGYFW